MTRKRGLGKGLDALIPTGAPDDSGVAHVALDAIQPNPRQPRTDFDSESLDELTESIRKHGVLQPLVVTAEDDGESYTLIAGERRLQAARKAGLASVPVVIRQASERERLELALIENLQRTDLNPLEAAEGYRQLAEDFELTHEEIAARVAKNRTTVSNTLRLLSLSARVKAALKAEQISEGHARALLGLPTAQAQSAALKAVVEKGLNVRQTEELVRRLSGDRKKPGKPAAKSPEERAIEEQLQQALGTRVTLRRGRRGGSLVLRFYSDEELNALVEQILGTS